MLKPSPLGEVRITFVCICCACIYKGVMFVVDSEKREREMNERQALMNELQAQRQAQRQERYRIAGLNLSVVLAALVERILKDNRSVEAEEKYHGYLDNNAYMYLLWIKIMCAKNSHQNLFGTMECLLSIYRRIGYCTHSEHDINCLVRIMNEYPCCDAQNVIPQLQLAINTLDSISFV
jgi:hypothetical protein